MLLRPHRHPPGAAAGSQRVTSRVSIIAMAMAMANAKVLADLPKERLAYLQSASMEVEH